MLQIIVKSGNIIQVRKRKPCMSELWVHFPALYGVLPTWPDITLGALSLPGVFPHNHIHRLIKKIFYQIMFLCHWSHLFKFLYEFLIFGGAQWQCSELISSSALRNDLWQYSRDQIQCQESNWGQSHLSQVP